MDLALESWLLARRTVKAMSLVVEHSKMTTVTVEQLSKCIQAAIEGKREELQRNFALVEQKEREADVLRRRIIEELARGELPVDERRGLMRLGRQIDWVTDWAHEASRILVLFDLSRIPKQIQHVALEMCSTVRDCTAQLTDCVQKLMDGAIEHTLKAADQVERLEEKVDKLYQKARSNLEDIQTDGIRVGAIILLSQFVEAIENTADRCEDSCDQVRVMAVTLSKRKD
jgi:predicted phosphate transport protein (TIGR00153 family)